MITFFLYRCKSSLTYGDIPLEGYPHDRIHITFRFALTEKTINEFQTIINEDSTSQQIYSLTVTKIDNAKNEAEAIDLGYFPLGFNLTFKLIPIENKEGSIQITQLKIELSKACPNHSFQNISTPNKRCNCLPNYWEKSNISDDCSVSDICFNCEKCWDNICNYCFDSNNGSCLENQCQDVENMYWFEGLCICRDGYYRTDSDSKNINLISTLIQ
jgi:hypothetical protein